MVAGLGLLGLAGVSLLTGSVAIRPGEFWELLLWRSGMRESAPELSGGVRADGAWAILWELRLPRTVAAILVGAALAGSGAVMQGLFRNPLADPSLLGVSAGAAMGAVTVLLLGTIPWVAVFTGALGGAALPVFAFTGAVVATVVVYRIAWSEGRTVVAAMLLAGIAVNALAMAYIGGAVFVAEYGRLREFHFWMLGSLALSSWRSLGALLPFTVLPLLCLPLLARPLNLFLLGEAEVGHLGYNAQRVKRWTVFLAAAMAGGTVAFCGVIGFIGLVAPHMARLLLGPDHRTLLPSALLLGAILLLAADLIARTLAAPAEVPVGILTALVGAPFFLFLLARGKSRLFG